MAEEMPATISSSAPDGIPLSQHSAPDISTESLIFQTSSMSATNSMLPHDLMTIQAMDTSEVTPSFSVNDIAVSSASDELVVTEYQLVDNGNGEFMVVTSTMAHKEVGLADSMEEQAQAITLNVEQAAQLLLQQQGLTQTLQLADGSLQVLDTSMTEKGGLPLEVFQALDGNFGQTLPSLDSNYCLSEATSVMDSKIEDEKVDAAQCDADKQQVNKALESADIQTSSIDAEKSENVGVAESFDSKTDGGKIGNNLDLGIDSSVTEDSVFSKAEENITFSGGKASSDLSGKTGNSTSEGTTRKSIVSGEGKSNMSGKLDNDSVSARTKNDLSVKVEIDNMTDVGGKDTTSGKSETDSVSGEAERDIRSEKSSAREVTPDPVTSETKDPSGNVDELQGGKGNNLFSETRKSSKTEIKEEKADMANPIPVTDQTVVMVKGKKCILAFNEETQQMCAYPIKQTTKKRGRPKMTEEEKLAWAEKRKREREQQTVQKTTPETPTEQSSAAETLLELSSVGADGVRRSARKRKKAKLLDEYEELEDSDDDEPFVDNQDKDPDIMVHLPDTKKRKAVTIELPPITTTTTTALFTPVPVAKRGRGRPRRYPPAGRSNIATSIPAVIIPSPNGQTIVMTELQGFSSLQTLPRQLPSVLPKFPSSVSTCAEVGSEIGSIADESDSLSLETSEALDSQTMIPTALQADSLPLVGGDTDPMETSHAGNGTDSTGGVKIKEELVTPTPLQPDKLNQATMIQIPDNLLPMLGIKKDPIKIGLKASESDLEKMKCPKCDFQGYYIQQYRAHIATHGDDIHKCKCCSFVSLSETELLAHFKESHPRCICLQCDFMAEHAYIVKRHMMRHNPKNCTCNICGKVYKDMYILKMHVKMVHMPAELLFECNVCCKKFTRKAHLKRHLRIHEPEKPYKCNQCEYRGCERSDISKHMLIHEEPKHVCERCGKAFRHIKNKALHVKRHFGQRDYKCGVCDFFGYTFTDIRKHIERKHQDIKTLICEKCNKPFRNEAALRDHQQVCNVMMLEHILSIPKPGSDSNTQATIQIPALLGPDGQQIILDGHSLAVDGQNLPLGSHTICVEGKTMTVNKDAGGDIHVTELLDLMTGEVGDDENILEQEDEDHAMSIVGETIMTEAGEELRIISAGSLGEAEQVVGLEDSQIATDFKQKVSESMTDVMSEQTVDENDQNIVSTVVDQGSDMAEGVKPDEFEVVCSNESESQEVFSGDHKSESIEMENQHHDDDHHVVKEKEVGDFNNSVS